MGGRPRTTAHIIIFSVALVLQIVVRPFDDFYANVSVTLFALCELFGALGELNVAAFQWIYVLTFLFALIVTGKFAVSALVERVKQQRQRPSAASGLEYDSPTSLSKCERALVAPFLLLVTVAVTCILAFVAFLYGLFRMLARCAYNSTRKDYDQHCMYETLDALCMGLLGIVYAILHAGSKGEHRKTLDSFGVGRLAERWAASVWATITARSAAQRKHKAEARAKVKTNGWEEPPRQIPPSSQQVSKPPKKWARLQDPSTGRPYFYNESTGESSWTCPLSAWAEAVDPASGRTYFYNSATKETLTGQKAFTADRWRKAIHARSFEEQAWNIIRFWARTESCRRARFAERRRIGRGGRGSSEGGYLVATSKCGKAIAGSANGPERVAEARGQDTKVNQSCCGQAQKCTRGHGRRGDYARIPQGAGRSSACVQVAL